MILDEMIQVAVEEFKQKMLEFGKKANFDELTPGLAGQMIEVLKLASRSACLAALVEFVQSYEVYAPTIEREGKILRWKELSPKEFLTIFGILVLPRGLYQSDRGGASYAPLDAKWGMEGEYATMDVREMLLFASAELTPGETSALWRKWGLGEVSPTAIYNIIKETGELLEENKDEINQGIREEETLPQTCRALAASLDGSNVLLREKGTRARRPVDRPRREDGPEEKCSTYKNAMVGSISFYGEAKPGQDCPERLCGIYSARMPEPGAMTLKEEWQEELSAAEAKLPADLIKIAICDGARPLWNYIESQERFADYERILDFHHTAEHLSKLGELLFGKQSASAKKWYNKYYQQLLEEDDGPMAIIRSIDYYQKKVRLSKAAGKELGRERGFFARNKARMRYAEFRRRNLPIGSGPVEAACKTIVKQRLCCSGMRWSRQGGQNILCLRTYQKSGRWDLFWKQYKRLKYASQYAA